MINDFHEMEENKEQSSYRYYRKKSFIIFAIMSIIILILIILLFTLPAKNKKCDKFKNENIKVFPNKHDFQPGEDIQFTLYLECDNGYLYEDLKDLNDLGIKLEYINNTTRKRFLSAEEFTVIQGKIKGTIMISYKLLNINIYYINIYIKNINITQIPLRIFILPGDPFIFEIKNFINSDKYGLINKNYTSEIVLLDKLGNNIIQDNYFISCESKISNIFSYEISIPENIKSDIFDYSSFTIDINSNNKKIILFNYRFKSQSNISNFILQLIIKKIVSNEDKKSILIKNPSQKAINIYRYVDLNNSIFNFINNELEITLFDSNRNSISFLNDTKLLIKGDIYSCTDLSFQANLFLVDKGNIIIGKVILNEQEKLSVEKCNYYVIEFSDPSVQDITVIYYKFVEVNISIDSKTIMVSKIYKDNFEIIANFNKTEYDYYLKDIFYGLEDFFNFDGIDITKEKLKVKSAIYFVLLRFFQQYQILYYEIVEEMEFHGDIKIFNNRYNIITLPGTAVGRKFYKVFIRLNIYSVIQEINLFFDEFLRPLAFDLDKGQVLNVFYFKDGKFIGISYQETVVTIIKKIVYKYNILFSDILYIYDEIIKINPSIIENYQTTIIDKIKSNINANIFEDFRKFIAFEKRNFVQVDSQKLNNVDYIRAAISFSISSTIKQDYSFSFIDFSSIKVGIINGDFAMILPQGILKDFTFIDKKAYEVLVILYRITTQKYYRFYVYLYYSNFNIIINKIGTSSATFVPIVDDKRISKKLLIDDIFISILSDSAKILAEDYILIRKDFEDKKVNPTGDEYDLCKDSESNGKKILVGKFDTGVIASFIKDSLTKKGFIVDIIEDPMRFVQLMNTLEYSSIWYFASCGQINLPKNFAESFKNLYANNKSLMIWGDNNPCFFGIDLILKEIVGSEYNFSGNFPGQQYLTPGDGIKSGTFDKTHPLSRGFVSLYEGITICSWNKPFPDYKSFANPVKHDYLPVIFYKEASGIFSRTLMDCAFTKLYQKYYNQDVGRYISNAACWLTNMDSDIDNSN